MITARSVPGRALALLRAPVARLPGALLAVAALLPGTGLLPGAPGAVELHAATAPTQAAASGPPASTDSVTLHGTIRAGELRPDSLLPGALIEVRQGERVRTAVSDARGEYRLEGLEPGRARVHVFHLATHSHEAIVRLPTTGSLSLDLELERRPLALEGVEVTTRRSPSHPTPVGPITVAPALPAGARSLDGSPGMVEAGLLGALGSMPGEEDPAPDRVLFMRGSTVDARTVLLDGAPVLTPFHVAGILPPFEADLMADADLYLGGAPARYEGGLSYLLDLGTRVPRDDGWGGSLAADGLLWKGTLEGAVPGGGGILMAGRSLHGFQGTLGSNEHFPYLYGDLLVRGAMPLAPGHQVSVTGYRNEEGVRLDEVLLEEGEAKWGNRARSVRYQGSFGGTRVSALWAHSRYDSSLPLAWTEPVVARAASIRERGAVDLVVPFELAHLHVGISTDRIDYRYLLDSSGPEADRLVVGEEVGMGVGSGGGYAEVSAPLGDRLDARAGLRADYFSDGTGLRMGPRASLRALLTEDAAVTISAGRYHQAVPMPGLAEFRQSAEEATLIWNPRLPVASSTHLVLSLDQAMDEHLRLGVSGFVKSFESLEGNGGDRTSASGTDLRISGESERLHAWLGYALSWFWEGAPGTDSSVFSGRHLVSAGVRGRPYEDLELGLTVGYGAGLPFSSVPIAAEETPGMGVPTMNGGSADRVRALSAPSGGAAPLEVAPEDDFLRLDVDLRWSVETRVAGHTAHLRPYLRILNALDSRDALFQYLDRWREGEMRPVARRPFLPLIGLEWRF